MKKIVISVMAVCLAVMAYANTKKLVLDVPTAQLSGTPVPVSLPNLEPKMPNPEPEVPADVTNIAKGKAVTSSDDFPLIGELTLITDGDKDAGEGYFVELMNGVQWIQIDLAKTSEIFAIAMWHFHSQERAYKDVIVQLSDDPEFKTGVVTIFNNDEDNSAGKGVGSDKTWIETNAGKLLVLKAPTKARYVRMYSNGNTSNDANSYIEVEVYGR